MDKTTAIAINHKMNQLTATIKKLSSVVSKDGTIEMSSEFLNDCGIPGSKLAAIAFNSNEIGRDYFDFIAYCKSTLRNLQQERTNLPSIPMDLFLQIK